MPQNWLNCSFLITIVRWQQLLWIWCFIFRDHDCVHLGPKMTLFNTILSWFLARCDVEFKLTFLVFVLLITGLLRWSLLNVFQARKHRLHGWQSSWISWFLFFEIFFDVARLGYEVGLGYLFLRLRCLDLWMFWLRNLHWRCATQLLLLLVIRSRPSRYRCLHFI